VSALPSAPSLPTASSRVRTPRRRSVAMFVAALAMCNGCEVCVFSPARRASRKILERIHEVRSRFCARPTPLSHWLRLLCSSRCSPASPTR
jgi:hypothetical protein